MIESLSPIVVNITPGLPEVGKIKIGKKGVMKKSRNGTNFQMPEKLDYFLITKLDKGEDGNFIIDKELHKALGSEPKKIPIKLLYNDIALNFQCRRSCYYGKTMYCVGDGSKAYQLTDKNSPSRTEVACPCYRSEPTFAGDNGKGKGLCKLNGVLSVLIDSSKANVGGVWKFRTTGYNSTSSIISSLTLIKSITGGLIAGIPLNLTITPKTTTIPTTGATTTIMVVSIEFAGSVSELKDASLKIALSDATYRQRIDTIEAEARKLLSVNNQELDNLDDNIDEFYPEEAIVEAEKKEPVKKVKAKKTKKVPVNNVEEVEPSDSKTESEPFDLPPIF